MSVGFVVTLTWSFFISCCVVFVFNVPPTAKDHMETGPRLKVSSDRLVEPGIKPATPGLQGKWLIHYTTAAPIFHQ